MDFNRALDSCKKRLSFYAVDPEEHVEILGVSYLRIDLPDGGELYLTRYGWSRMPSLLPEHWFANQRYLKEGVVLPGGTGNVYQLPVPIPHGKNPLKMVVKFSRAGQDVPVFVADKIMEELIPEEEVSAAVWNSPFEEFSLLWDLRIGRYGGRRPKIRTKRPLAIYCPPTEYQDWQLGRHSHIWWNMDYAIAHGQKAQETVRVHLHSSRLYVVLFEWVDGINAEDCAAAGLIPKEEMISLSRRVTAELERKGYHMLDIKPRHFILRPDRKGGVLRRKGQIVYALIDFELLKRTQPYKQSLASDPKDFVI